MLQYTYATTEKDLRGILSLQQRNLTKSLSESEVNSQGFVTVEHTYELLKGLNDTENHIIAKSEDVVIGYVLSMTTQARFDISVLIPMFEILDRTLYNGKSISEGNYVVVGQVCVDKDFRGQGIFDKCYEAFKEFHKDKYDFAVTEIAQTNFRSLKAHKRKGFTELTTYKDPNNTTWIVVIWDWIKEK